MKLFIIFLLLLPFAAVVQTVRGERQNVLSFLNEALATITEKTVPAKSTGHRNSSSRPINVQDSEDLSDPSRESFETNTNPEPVASEESEESKDSSDIDYSLEKKRLITKMNELAASKAKIKLNCFSKLKPFKELSTTDLDSNEILVPKAVAKEQVPSRRMAQVGQNIRIQGELQASDNQTDHNSTEGTMVVSDRTSQSADGQSRAGRVNRMYRKFVLDRSREMPDWDSLEDKNGRFPAEDESKLAEYDESREDMSSETYLLKPSGLSAPTKNRAA